MEVFGDIRTRVEVSPVDVLERLKIELGFDHCFVRDNKVYRLEPDNHNDYDTVLHSTDFCDVETLNSINCLLSAVRRDPRLSKK